MRIIRRVVKVKYPLTSTSGLERRSVSLDPYTLDVNATYILSRRTPLVDNPAPNDPLAAIARMRDMPPGSKIRVLRSVKVKGGLWYEVIATDARGRRIGDALLSQAFSVARERRSEALTLAVDGNNVYAWRLYRRWGFRETTRRRAWIAHQAE
ncbi:MAG: GNAT family N-acetyltransferase [Planctomycetes bacterium]|nr:GNAT family N-acetyltransferase [Planctomycetota bacterium]